MFETISSKLNREELVSFFHSGSEPNAFHLALISERSGKLNMYVKFGKCEPISVSP